MYYFKTIKGETWSYYKQFPYRLIRGTINNCSITFARQLTGPFHKHQCETGIPVPYWEIGQLLGGN